MFDQVLPAGSYWLWTERLETTADLAVLTDPALTEGVARYLAVRDDPEACGDFFVTTLAGANPRLRQDSLSLIASRREIATVLDAGRLQPVSQWLRRTDVLLPDRARVLVSLARAGAVGVRDVAEGFAGTESPMLAPAIDALVTIDQPPPVPRLIAYSKSSDEVLRLVASRGLVDDPTPPAVDRLAELLKQDKSATVRTAIAHGLGGVRSDERIVKMLAGALDHPEKSVMSAAAESLARIGSHEATVALGAALEHGRPDVQTAAAFALKRSNKQEAENLLEMTEATHPDPKVRRLCKLARGESMHEH